MEYKQCASEDLNYTPYSNQGFLADRFAKSNNLNIPDTIPENCTAESSEDSLKMEAPKVAAQNFSNAEKENVGINLHVSCSEPTNSSTIISIDNSYIRQCERKLLENSNSEDDKIIESDKSVVNKRFLDVQRKLLYHNDTISTPPSLLRKEISLLRNEMIEAHEFHDLEIQVLKEEKLNEEDSYNYLKLFEKYSTLMELYTTLKTEYDDYRKEQEKIRQEYQSKTANCLEFLCSQIETSDNSLNFSNASFISFNGGIKSSTMMEDVSEVEGTLLQDATVLANDPLSITNDVIFKTPLKTPLKSAKKFEGETNSIVTEPLVEDEVTKHKTEVHLNSECNIQLLNLEAALYDKVKEVKELEQRLFRVEDLSSVLQNEFERITSVYLKENNILKENLGKKTELLNELTVKLFTEIISLKPSLRDSLSDISGIRLLVIFIETVMESCKKIQNEEIIKHNAEKADWEANRKLELMKIEDLQNQTSSHLTELENFKKLYKNLEIKLRDAESIILNRNEEIQILQSQVSTLRKTQEDFVSVKETLSKLESRLTLTEAEKKAAENRYRELEGVVENLEREIETNKKLQLQLQAQLLTGEVKKSEIEIENIRLKELHDALKDQKTEIESILKSKDLEIILLKENLASADKTILQLKSQLQFIETEKTDLENRYRELQENNQHILVEINAIKDFKNILANEKINENDNLKQRILDKEEIIAELKTESVLSKESQMNNIHKVEELTKEKKDEIEKENSEFSKTPDVVEESLKNLADLLSDVTNNSDLPNDRIEKLIEKSSEFQESTEIRGIKLKESYDTVKVQMTEDKNIIFSRDEKIRILQSAKSELMMIKGNLMSADETISQLKSQLKLIEAEKCEVENRCSELQESNQRLRFEISTAKNLETNPAFEKIQTENDDLKQRIFEFDKIIEELKSELELAKKDRTNNFLKVEELIRETEKLKKENIDFSNAFTTIEEAQKNLEDVLSVAEQNSDLTSDKIIKLLAPNSKLFNVDTKQSKIVTDFIGTVTKTCKEVQNELMKKFDNKLLEWESQKDIDVQNFQDQIKLLTEKNVQYEAAVKKTKDSLETADDTIVQLKSQLSLTQTEKTEIEIHCQKLKEESLVLQAEIDTKETIIKELNELKVVWKKIKNENDDLKQRIFESDKMIEELKSELELAKKDRTNNFLKVEELIRETEKLKKENIDFSNAFTTIEEAQKNLEDVLSVAEQNSDLTSDKIIKLLAPNSKLFNVDTKQSKIVTDFIGTVTKTCKEVQNELMKKFDNKLLEWESQKDIDVQNFQDQIKLLTEKNVQYEAAVKKTKDSLETADDTIVQLKSQLSLTQTEKTEIEIHCQKLKEESLVLQAEIDTKETIIRGLDELKIVWKKIEIENGDLKKQALESEEVIVRLKTCLEIRKEEQSKNEMKIHELQNEIDLLKKEREELVSLSGKLEGIEKNNKNLLNVLLDIQSQLDMPEDTLTKLMSSDFENKKIFSEKINSFVKAKMEGLKAENKHLKFGIDNLKQKLKQLTKLICETANNDLKEELSNLNNSHPYSMSLRSKSKNMDICLRRLDKLEEINHNLIEMLTRILNITEFPDLEKLKLCSVKDFSGTMKKIVAHFKHFESKMKELKEENAQLDEECETYSNIIKDLKKEAAAVWKSNTEKTEAMELKISRLNEEKNCLEKEKQDLLAKISKFEGESQKLKSTSKIEEPFHNCVCGNESKKISELKRAILVKEQKLLELQDLEAQTSSYKSQIEYLKTALEREKKKVGEEREKNKKLQNEQNESTKKQKTENKKTDENQILDELRMRGSISGGIVQEFVDKEKMRKLSKDIGILKELCRARYAEIKRLEAVNAALRNGTPKNSNQMDSPLRSGGYNTRSKNQVKNLWRTEISGKENGAL